jgi:hypothetical protein
VLARLVLVENDDILVALIDAAARASITRQGMDDPRTAMVSISARDQTDRILATTRHASGCQSC